jgi:hypothetical protein
MRVSVDAALIGQPSASSHPSNPWRDFEIAASLLVPDPYDLIDALLRKSTAPPQIKQVRLEGFVSGFSAVSVALFTTTSIEHLPYPPHATVTR